HYPPFLEERASVAEIQRFLFAHNLDIKRTALKARLRQWGLQRGIILPGGPVLEIISDLFHSTAMTESEIDTNLTWQGFSVSTRQVKRARLASGLRRRNNTLAQQQQQREATS